MSSSFIPFAVVIFSGSECREDDAEYGMNLLLCCCLLLGCRVVSSDGGGINGRNHFFQYWLR